jgi:2-polyprenyl-3-methyl-5-hydroxy-6-metoxy-1,4-benzoquinol methylase
MSDLSNGTLAPTGERLLTEWRNENTAEHLHRYAIALSLCTGRDVLDIACGEGYGSNLLSSVASLVIGVDISRDAIDHATCKYAKPNLRFITGSASAIPAEPKCVDVVASFETIEHLAEQEEMISEIARVLRPGGVLIMSSPNKHNYSDVPGTRNPYHVRELYTAEFRALLRKSFAHVDMYFQSVVLASLVIPERTGPGHFRYYSGGFDGVQAVTGLPNAVYNICLASDAPLPQLPCSAFDAQFVTEEAKREKVAMNARTKSLQKELETVKRSTSFRLGRAITAPMRWFRR